jgi:nicotinamide-nucleotide amidase
MSGQRRTAPGVELLSIGNELLLGETVDTNATWIAARLASEGIAVLRKTTVGDDVALIRDALAAGLRRCGTVICTGGLGPTPDDLTRHALAELYARRLVVDDAWLDVLRARYARRGMTMPAINRVQAEHPAGATLLPNARGTAPGMALADQERGLTILLPGVPSEMRGLLEAEVLPLLRERLRPAARFESRVIRTAGISEAALAERIADIAGDVAPLSLAFLPQGTGVDLRLTFAGSSAAAGDAVRSEAGSVLLDRAVARLSERLGHDVFALEPVDLAAVVGGMLRERGMTLAVAESCTGGLVAKRLTDAAGASDYVRAGFVTYSNDAKRDMLGVAETTLAAHGAVSEACAREMAEGARRAARADAAMAITGVAGPGGGSAEKPVGTVWMAVALESVTHVRHVIFPGDRSEVRERSAQAALDMLRRALAGTLHG